MKKFLCILSAVILIFSLSACSGNTASIEDCQWKMQTVANNIPSAENDEELILAVGDADEAYPDAKVLEMILTAKNGEITITDSTNNKIYEGKYKKQRKTRKTTLYEIEIDGLKGYEKRGCLTKSSEAAPFR